MKCPYCGERDCILEVAYTNVEFYDSKSFHMPCTKCDKMIQVCIVREVRLVSIEKSDKKRSESDF